MTDQTNPLTLAEDGKKEYGKGNFKDAAGLFSQAAQAYASEGDELNAAEMKNNESVAYLQAGNAQEALQAVEGTEEVFLKAGDLKRQGIAISNRAAALEGLKSGRTRLQNMTGLPRFSNRQERATCTPWSANRRPIST